MILIKMIKNNYIINIIMLNILILIILATVFYIIVNNYNKSETFLGALTQLHARGPQDLHLTVNSDKYIYQDPYYRGWWDYPYYLWNMPTRYNRYNSYYYGNYLFPYQYY